MNTEIITSVLAVDLLIVLVYVVVRLSEICEKEMVRESEEDCLFFKHDFDTYMKVYAWCKNQRIAGDNVLRYALMYPHSEHFFERLHFCAEYHYYCAKYPEIYMED